MLKTHTKSIFSVGQERDEIKSLIRRARRRRIKIIQSYICFAYCSFLLITNTIECTMQRLGGVRSSILRSAGGPELKKKALNSWSAIQDTFYSTKDTFERHRVVFTVGTSIASVATAWIGYSLRHLHDTRVDKRLNSIEEAMKKNYHIEHDEIKKIVNSGSVSTATCAAASSVCLVLGYGMGWRGGKWYTNRKFRKEQMKLLGQIKPRWKFPLRPLNSLNRLRSRVNASKTSDSLQSDTAITEVAKEVRGSRPSG